MQMKGQAPLAWDLDGGEQNPSRLQNHGTKGGNILFADGHVETKRWRDDRTIKQPKGLNYHEHDTPMSNSRDLKWLQAHTTALK